MLDASLAFFFPLVSYLGILVVLHRCHRVAGEVINLEKDSSALQYLHFLF